MSQTQNPSKSDARRRHQNPGRKRHQNNNRRGRPTQRSPRKPEPKPTLTQRILRLFGLGGKTQTPTRPTVKITDTRGRSQEKGDNGRGVARQRREVRRPDPVEVSSPRLYVGNLNYDAVETDLEEVFNGAGRVEAVEIVTNSRTQRSKGYGFVEMATVEEAKRAVETLHDQEFMGRKLLVSGARPRNSQESAATNEG